MQEAEHTTITPEEGTTPVPEITGTRPARTNNATKRTVKRKPIRNIEDLLSASTKGMSDKEKDNLIAYLREQANYLTNKLECLDGSFKELVQSQRTKEAAQFKAIQDYRNCVNTLIQSISNSNNVATMAVNMLKAEIGKEN